MTVFSLFSVFIAIVSVLLVGTILLQEPKESIANYGGSMAPVQRIGINPKTDFLEKTTWVLVGLLLTLTLLSGLFLRGASSSSTLESPNLIQLEEEKSACKAEPTAMEPAKENTTTEATPDTAGLAAAAESAAENENK
jgi:protein translocase SecG subunit